MKFRYEPETEELVVSDATRIEYHQINLWLTRHVKGYRYKPQYKAGIWDGKISYFRNGRINMGLWKECALACREIQTPFVIENTKDFPVNREVTLESVNDFCKSFFKGHQYKTGNGWVDFYPHEHQIDTAYKILRNRYCMAEVATSGGKSLIISIVMFYILNHIDPNAKFLLIVPSISLVTQFYDDLLKNYHGENNISNIHDNYYLEIELDDGTILKLKNSDKIMTKTRGEIFAKDLTELDEI